MNSVEKNKVNNIKVTEQKKDVGENVNSIINFIDYKEDIEAFLSIERLKNKYDKKGKRLDLTNFVFSVFKKLFKEDFLDYINHPDFKKLILNVYGLDGKGDFKIFFNAEPGKESFVLMNISNNGRYYGFSSDEVDRFIINQLKIKDNIGMESFIKDIIYGIDESFEKYNGVEFKNFIYSNIYDKVNDRLITNNIENLFLSGAEGIDSQKLLIKAMSGKIYRDNFSYIHKVSGHKLMGDIPKLVLDELLGTTADDFRKKINQSFDKIIYFLNNFDSKKQSILDIENEIKNDLLLGFQDKIKLYFQKFDNTEIDNDLLRGAINFLIENNNLKLKINDFTESIFSLFENNINDLVLLFGKFNGETLEENGNKYKYNKFDNKYITQNNGKYNIEEILLGIQSFILEINNLERGIIKLKNELEELKVSNYDYNINIGKQENTLLKYNDIILELSAKYKNIQDEIKIELGKKDGFLNKMISKNNKVSILEKEKRDIYDDLLVITQKYHKLENKIFGIKTKLNRLNQGYIDKTRKIDDLTLVCENKKKLLEKIKDNFIRNILFGREVVN